MSDPLYTGRGGLAQQGVGRWFWLLHPVDRIVARADALTGKIINGAIPLPDGFEPYQIGADKRGSWVLLQEDGSLNTDIVRVAIP